ncbi:phospho-N-acetylmuramoyl-pentapeptide-transferase [Deferrisoma camini]|uniref:phospho-N-acetylmuramoyl-pentapeptide- transferase n=1 Tax=Deferrisoma camini TaxID=1035120 RepID=UPI00046CAEC9|nr:phospho-N-acetylmuramoyl-pentapeptide-transferase [Deferrisoma camini]
MLYRLLYGLSDAFGPFNVFRYLTFRSVLGMLTALGIALFFGPAVIRWLERLKVGQAVRDDGPERHLAKAGTPTMGGILILVGLGVATLAWSDPLEPRVWIVLGITFGFAAVGFADDYLKVTRRNSRGLPARAKFWSLVVVATAGCTALWALPGFDTRLAVPFFKNLRPDLGWAYIPFAVFVVVGAGNAVNLTDGLDGLAIGPVITASLTYLIFTYTAGHARIAEYLQIPWVPGAGELAVFCAAMAGAALGFLWYNAYPAQVFMGDVGSLALGGALGAVAVVSKSEIVLAVVGGVFVVEALSVMIQVVSFKTRGKRVFRMAPIHHHFELKGWAEPKIIVRFWIVSIILALLGLGTLKLR